MRSMKEIFEFLKPNRWNLSITILFIIAGAIVWFKFLPGTNVLNALRIPAEELSASGNKLLGKLIAAVMAGLIVISYTLISIIVYFVTGRYKDE